MFANISTLVQQKIKGEKVKKVNNQKMLICLTVTTTGFPQFVVIEKSVVNKIIRPFFSKYTIVRAHASCLPCKY